MLARVVLFLLVIPVVELAVLVSLGHAIGAPAVLGLVVGSALLGLGLSRREGARVLREWQGSVQRGELPREGLTSSVLLVLAGILFVVPGILTDAAGLLLLVPPLRRAIGRKVSTQVEQRFQVRMTGALGPVVRPRARGPVIDVEARTADDEATTDVQALEHVPR